MKGRSNRLQNSDPPDDWVNGSWTVDCVCGVNFDDGEEMVNCDECGVWVHTRCSRYVKGDDIFVCDKCKGQNARNESEETEVAQLLVELPTKTIRMENRFASNGPPRHPFRLWTDIPIEERVHVQGIPGGDPALFSGLSTVFTPELWKCTGYVPKKFNFQYKEFPCWDEKLEDGTINNEESENPVDKGAGVLFSLSKENVLGTHVAALAGMRGKAEEGVSDRKVSLKVKKKSEVEDVDKHAENCMKKERSLVPPIVLHSGKRKKEDLFISRDRNGKKKPMASDKETDMERRIEHLPTSVVTPTIDAKPLEFYQDRDPEYDKTDIQINKNNDLREALVREHVLNAQVRVDKNLEKPNNNIADVVPDPLPSAKSKHNLSNGAELKEEKVDVQIPPLISSLKVNGAVSLLSERKGAAGNVSCVQEGEDMEIENSDESVGGFARRVAKPPVDDPPTVALEVEDNQNSQDFDEGMTLNSIRPDFKLRIEAQLDNSRELLNVQSSSNCEVKELGISSDQVSENSKVNDATVSSSLSGDSKAQEVNKGSEAVSDYRIDSADELSDRPCHFKREVDGSNGSLVLHRTSSEPKNGSGIDEEQSKSCRTVLNSQALPSRKPILYTGKSSSTSSTVVISKSSSSGNSKPAENLSPNATGQLRVMSDSGVTHRKEQTSSNKVRDVEREEMPRRPVKEHPKSDINPSKKTLNSSRIVQDPASRRTTSDSKDLLFYSSSRTSSAHKIPASGPGESIGSQRNQRTLHAQNKIPSSSVPHRGEKFSQTHCPTSSKVNQNHASTMYPPLRSNTPANLSDEELALLLHQELNSSPRVPRVPRLRHTGSLPQLASPNTTSILIKRTSSSGGKDPGLASRRKNKDASTDTIKTSSGIDDEAKRTDRIPYSSPEGRRQDISYAADASTKREGNRSPPMVHTVKKDIPSASTVTGSYGRSSSTEANDRNLSSRNSPRNTSDDDTDTIGGSAHHTLPGLINEIMSKGRRMTYEELCDAVLPHWHNLRKHNGERYAYSSHSQAVLDCLRNRQEWAQLVDRGPKTNSSRKRHKIDAEESEDSEYGKENTAKDIEDKSLESQIEDVPKGKRKARKRRRLALQGRVVKELRSRPKKDLIIDNVRPVSNSSDESMFSEDEYREGEECQQASEASASSDEAVK